MRIATWNVNSLKARQDAVENWLKRADPDVLLMQETKLPDQDAPVMAFAMAGYDLIHHGEGRWNGVAVAVRHGMSAGGVLTNFGLGGVRDSSAGASASVSEEDFDPLDEARMMNVTANGIRIVSIYAPNGRVVGSQFFAGKLAWYQPAPPVAARELRSGRRPRHRRRLQHRPDRCRCLGSECRARRHPRVARRARRVRASPRSGAWWTRTDSSTTSRAASRGGTTGRACSTRTSGCGSTTCW